MEDVIYSKFSNDRADSFAIITEIVKGSFKKNVRKRALTPKSMEHIAKQADYYNKYSDLYKRAGYELAPCSLYGNALVYKYIDGKSLNESLTDIYKEDKNEFVAAVTGFCQNIRALLNQNKKWTCTDKYIEIFGISDERIYEMEACDYINIDLIPDNIILNGGKNYIIDYEWIFDFPIPIDYVIYRIITSVSERTDNKIFDALSKSNGITAEDGKLYSEMEKNFQKYILKGNSTVTGMYKDIGKRVYNINDYISEIEEFNRMKAVQLFYDTGDGFSEERKCMFYELEGQYMVSLPDGVKRLRIDPCSRSCVINSITVDDQVYSKDKLHKLDTNAIVLDDKLIFCTEDPQIIIDIQNKSKVKIGIEYNNEADAATQLNAAVSKIEAATEAVKVRMYIENVGFEVNRMGQNEINAAGWLFALDNKIDEVYIVSYDEYYKAVYGMERSDVFSAFPDVNEAMHSGFSFNVKDTGLRETIVHLIMYSNGMLVCAKKITLQGDKY